MGFYDDICSSPDLPVVDEFGYSSLGRFTDCFLELVILGLVNLTFLVFGGWRLMVLIRG